MRKRYWTSAHGERACHPHGFRRGRDVFLYDARHQLRGMRGITVEVVGSIPKALLEHNHIWNDAVADFFYHDRDGQRDVGPCARCQVLLGGEACATNQREP